MGLCSAKSSKLKNFKEQKEASPQLQSNYENSQEIQEIQHKIQQEISSPMQQFQTSSPKKQIQSFQALSPSIKSVKRTVLADSVIENSNNRGTLKTYISLKTSTFSKNYSIVSSEKLKHSIKNHEQFALIQHNLSGKVKVVELIKKNNEGKQLVQEIIKSQLQHPNMIKIFDIFQDGKNYQIIHEFCNQHSLQQNLNQSTYSEQQVAIIIKQIIDITQYLHRYGYHHDFLTLKSFQKSNQSSSNYIKLIDYKPIYIKSKNIDQDSVHYLPPEAIESPDTYSIERDLWSIGVILYKLLSGKYPFKGSNLVEIQTSILQYSQNNQLDFKHIPKQCINLIKQFLQINPYERINLAKALDHEWLFKFIQESEEEFEIIIKQIKSHHPLSILQCCFLQFLISTFLQEQELHLYQLFRQFDSNHDGKLNRTDLFQAYLKCSSNLEEVKEQVDSIFQSMDFNTSGEIDFQQFLIGTIDKNQLLTEDNLKEAFKLLSDIDGNITLQKMTGLYSNKKQALKTFFSNYENNQINYKQFEKLMYDAI